MLTLPGGAKGGSVPVALDGSVFLDKGVVRVSPDYEKGLTGCYRSMIKDLEQQVKESEAVIMAAGRDREKLEAQIENLNVQLKLERTSHNDTVIEAKSASFHTAVGIALGVIIAMFGFVGYLLVVRP